MIWPLVNICTGLFLLALAFKPEWFGMDLKTELATRPKQVGVLKWIGAIIVIFGLLDFLARFLGFL